VVAGAVGVDQEDPEIGWMILPEFQNRGIASQAVREVLERARVEQKFGQIHAFPRLGAPPELRKGSCTSPPPPVSEQVDPPVVAARIA
jgi:GNAT superfamily N-acetyltransferase